MEVPARRMSIVTAVVFACVLSAFAIPASAQSVTAFEGARLIVGDGRVIENATLVVDGAKIAQAGAAAEVRVPSGRQARESRRQDRDADDHRHARPS